MKHILLTTLALFTLTSLAVAGPRETSAVNGAAIGAVVGAGVGWALPGGPATAWAGTGIGALAGGLLGLTFVKVPSVVVTDKAPKNAD